MSHGSISPPSRLCSPSRDRAPALARAASVPNHGFARQNRYSGVNNRVAGRLQDRNFSARNPGFVMFSRRDMAFRDGGLTNVAA